MLQYYHNYFLNRISNSYVIFLQIEFGCVFLYPFFKSKELKKRKVVMDSSLNIMWKSTISKRLQKLQLMRAYPEMQVS